MTTNVSTNQINLDQFKTIISQRPDLAVSTPSNSILQGFVDQINALNSMSDFRTKLLAGRYEGMIDFAFKGNGAETSLVTGSASFNKSTIVPDSFVRSLANEQVHMDNNPSLFRLIVAAAESKKIAFDAATSDIERAEIRASFYTQAFRQKLWNESASELKTLEVSLEIYRGKTDPADRDAYLVSIGRPASLGGEVGFRRVLFDYALAAENQGSLSQADLTKVLQTLSFNLLKSDSQYLSDAISRAFFLSRTYGMQPTDAKEMSLGDKNRLLGVDRYSEGNFADQRLDINGNQILTIQIGDDNWISRTLASTGVEISAEVIVRDNTGKITGVTIDPATGGEQYRSAYAINDDGSKTELVTFPNGTTAVRTYDSGQQLYSFATENSNGNQRTVNTVFTDGRNLQELYVGGQLTNTSLTQVITGGVVQTQVNDGGGANLSTTNVQTFDDGSKLVVITLASGKVITTGVDALGASTGSTEQLTVGNVTTTVSRNGDGGLVQTRSVQKFEDTSSITETSLANGAVVTTTVNNLGQTSSVTGTAAPLDGFGSFITDLNGVVQAIRSGQPLPILSSSLRLINDQINPRVGNVQTVSNQGVFTATAVVSAVASIYSLYQAFDSNASTIDKISATANTIASVSSAVSALNTANVATGAAEGAATEVASQSAGESIGQSLPYVNIAVALYKGDLTGLAVAVAAACEVPYVGWIYACYLIVDSMYSEEADAWGYGTLEFAGPGVDVKATVTGGTFGPEKVSLLMNGDSKAADDPEHFPGVLPYLNTVVSRFNEVNPATTYGIIPQRVATVIWNEERLADPGYRITEIDPLTGEEKYPSLRYGDNLQPFNGDPADPLQRRNIFARMVDSALARHAIAPMWEVQTARLQVDANDPNAGLTEEDRAARRGHAAGADANGKRLPGVFRPIVLDLNGDSTITTVSNANSNVKFDWNDTGFKAETGWVAPTEGFLMLDRNSNGIVDSGKELFSNGAVDSASRGVRSMSWVDSNGDGVIDGTDPVFAALRVWQDANSDGKQNVGEMKTLAELGITKLDYNQARFTRNGQEFSMASPEIEASTVGVSENVVVGGLQVTHSTGASVLQVTSAQVTNAGGGTGQGTTFTVSNEIIASFEDGISPPSPNTPFSQDPTQHQAIQISVANLLANDRFNGSDLGLTITGVANAQRGSVTLDAANGVVLFNSEQNYNGQASFEYTVAAPDGQTRIGQAVLNLQAVNDRPTVNGAVLYDRPIYGYGPLTTIGDAPPDPNGIGLSGTVTVERDQGKVFTTPYATVGGNRVYRVPNGQFNDGQEGSDVVVDPNVTDTGIPVDYYNAGQGRVYPTNDGVHPEYRSASINGESYWVNANPPTFLHNTPIGAIEHTNDGQLTATDVDGPINVVYEIATNGLYGEATINPTSGVFEYTGRRSAGVDSNGFSVGGNQLSDAYIRSESTPAFNDIFEVRVIDKSDSTGNTFTIQQISVPHYGPRPSPNVANGAGKPIAIDLGGDGFQFINVDDSNVFLDVAGDGIKRRTSWVGPNDGMLAYDENANGKIDSPKEISFARFLTGAQTDLEGLRAFDTNHDGVFTAADAKWNSFGVWRDANSNGVSEAGEFQSLTAMGIASIALTADGQFRVINGQTVHGTRTLFKRPAQRRAQR
jgi:Cadherin-like domain